jgi:hypothetical protein
MPSDADQLSRGRAVLSLLLDVQRELAHGTKPAELPAALRLPPARVRWALAVLAMQG